MGECEGDAGYCCALLKEPGLTTTTAACFYYADKERSMQQLPRERAYTALAHSFTPRPTKTM